MPTVVVTETISTHYIDASGNTYDVEVSYGPEAGIPSGAQLEVAELTGDEADAYAARAAEALNVNGSQVAYAKALDINIMADGQRVQQLDRHGHGGLGLDGRAVCQYGDVQGLGVGDLAVVYVQGLGGACGIGFGLVAGQLGHRQLRAGGDAGLGAVADLHAIGVARGVYVMGGDGLGDHHGWHTNYVQLV